MERFYVRPENIGAEEAYITGEELKHLARVLRLKPGVPLEIFDGLGRGFRCTLKTLETERAAAEILAPIRELRDSTLNTCLWQGIPKGEKMEWIVQKVTELGVTSVVPAELSRCVVRLDNDKKRRERRERWQKVAQEASRQSGRLKVPPVEMPVNLKQLLAGLKAEDLLLVPWEKGGLPLKELIPRLPAAQVEGLRRGEGTICFMVGPEGGLTEEEVELAREAGGLCLTLGPRILRTETAAVMLLSLLQYIWGDAAKAPSAHFEAGDSD